jgi:hypothetical protein
MVILDALLDGLRGVCGAFPDKRKGGDVIYSMADIGMAGFAPFFMQSESFLAHQRSLAERHKTSNCQSLFGISRIPTDNHIRAMLDPVPPALLQPVFDQMLCALRDCGGLKTFERLDGRTLIALDGTEYFCSQKLGCPNCQTRKRANGKMDYYHSMLAATLVAPGHNIALPLMPEFIVKQDGAEKQDCERNAARRWLAAHAGRVRELRPVYLGDDLFACQPICEAVLESAADFLFTAKPQSHKTLYDFMQGAAYDELLQTRREGAKKLTCRYRWFSGAPLREEKPARDVNWLGVTITDAKGKTVYDGAFVTSLVVTPDNVAQIAACARARWKIENEGFNVLKNNGYHLEHNFGHGKQNLAMLFCAMNLLAFAMHTLCDIAETLWIKARYAKRARKRFFEHIRMITEYLVFPDWMTLMETLIASKPPPHIEKQIWT